MNPSSNTSHLHLIRARNTSPAQEPADIEEFVTQLASWAIATTEPFDHHQRKMEDRIVDNVAINHFLDNNPIFVVLKLVEYVTTPWSANPSDGKNASLSSELSGDSPFTDQLTAPEED